LIPARPVSFAGFQDIAAALFFPATADLRHTGAAVNVGAVQAAVASAAAAAWFVLAAAGWRCFTDIVGTAVLAG
jgi:hypothetical protein